MSINTGAIETALKILREKRIDPRYVSDDDLLALRNVGTATVKEIRRLAQIGHPSITAFDDLFVDELPTDCGEEDAAIAARLGMFHRRLMTWGVPGSVAGELTGRLMDDLLGERG